MANLILVHGSWHGAWAWDKLIPFLENAGHRVLALDMPGRGSNPAPLAQQTQANYVSIVVEAIDRSDEAVYLVGHSAGGPVVSEAAEARPDKVRALIYVCAFMLTNGQSVLDIANADAANEILPSVEFIADGNAMAIKPENARSAFYGDCSDDDVAWAISRLGPEIGRACKRPHWYFA